jgi:hypothetical protein
MAEDSLKRMEAAAFWGRLIGTVIVGLADIGRDELARKERERTLRIEQRAAQLFACWYSPLTRCSCTPGQLAGDEEREAFALAKEMEE